MYTYFQFNGNSSDMILDDSKLVICHMEGDYSSTAPIFNRELIKTDFSHQQDYRRIIGSKYSEGLVIKFSLIKQTNDCRYEDFTFNEIETISNWLYGNGLAQKFEIYCDEIPDNYSYYLNGMFTNIERVRHSGTIALTCTFESNSQYLYQYKSMFIRTYGSNNTQTENVRCQSIVYPVITITPKIEYDNVHILISNGNRCEMDMLFNITDNNFDFKIDTKNAIIIKDMTTNLSFKDIGWNSIEDISWLYLSKGANDITIKMYSNENPQNFYGGCDVRIEWEDKILGGVLNEFSI